MFFIFLRSHEVLRIPPCSPRKNNRHFWNENCYLLNFLTDLFLPLKHLVSYFLFNTFPFVHYVVSIFPGCRRWWTLTVNILMKLYQNVSLNWNCIKTFLYIYIPIIIFFNLIFIYSFSDGKRMFILFSISVCSIFLLHLSWSKWSCVILEEMRFPHILAVLTKWLASPWILRFVSLFPVFTIVRLATS